MTATDAARERRAVLTAAMEPPAFRALCRGGRRVKYHSARAWRRPGPSPEARGPHGAMHHRCYGGGL